MIVACQDGWSHSLSLILVGWAQPGRRGGHLLEIGPATLSLNHMQGIARAGLVLNKSSIHCKLT